MKRRYVTADVFTDQMFGGNPLAVALAATIDSDRHGERAWRIHQGVDMGRPSLLLGRTAVHEGAVTATHIGGRCVAVLEGSLVL